MGNEYVGNWSEFVTAFVCVRERERERERVLTCVIQYSVYMCMYTCIRGGRVVSHSRISRRER